MSEEDDDEEDEEESDSMEKAGGRPSEQPINEMYQKYKKY
jgi:hypothetical protein